MYFSRYTATHTETGARAAVWLPNPSDAIEPDAGSDNVTTVELGAHRRQILTSLVRMATEFTLSTDRRAQLGHDCAVFALACETNDPLHDTPFNQTGGQVVRVGERSPATMHQDEPSVAPGVIVFTSAAEKEGNEGLTTSPHFMVRASVDQSRPLYFSKLGAGGPVVLSTFSKMIKFYPVAVVGTARDLFTENYRSQSTGPDSN